MFDLLDEDGSDTISAKEFNNIGFLFNFQKNAIKRIFLDFDISGDKVFQIKVKSLIQNDKYSFIKELDLNEFKMFSMACIDCQRELDSKNEINLNKLNKKRKPICNIV